MTTTFDQFVDLLEHVPAEFERNFTLIRELDERTCANIDEINQLIDRYTKEDRRGRRKSIREKITSTLKQILSLADDKISLTVQTYETVDKNIRQMYKFSNAQKGDGQQILGSNMPMLEDEPRFCTCNGVSCGEMIACDNPDCLIEWFHMNCMQLTKVPKGKWYCPNCQPEVSVSSKR